jgi:hypothetical protein
LSDIRSPKRDFGPAHPARAQKADRLDLCAARGRAWGRSGALAGIYRHSDLFLKSSISIRMLKDITASTMAIA